MTFLQFIFFFLYVRNWHTGKLELSRTRLVATLLIVGSVIIFFSVLAVLQAPTVYESPVEVGE